MTNVPLSKGFIAPEILPDHYVLGGKLVPQDILQPDGQWDGFLPPAEVQLRNGFDPLNCTAFATTNALEMVMAKKFGGTYDKCERAVGIAAGTKYLHGNSPHTVIEIIRTEAGLIDEFELPFDGSITTWDAYYSPDPLPLKLQGRGKEWLSHYTVMHEWVFTDGTLPLKQEKLKEALRYSPVGVSVLGWRERDGLFVKRPGEPDNHWTLLYGYEDGKYWKVFDSYQNVFKRLAWDYDFGYAKRYHVEKKTPQDERSNLWDLYELLKARLTSLFNGRLS